MLAFLGYLILFSLVASAIIAAVGLFAAVKCHDAWVDFLTGSGDSKKSRNPYHYHSDGTPRD